MDLGKEAIPTLIIDWPDLIFIGLLFGFAARGIGEGLLKTRAFLSGSIVTLGFIGLAAYSYIIAPDWMWMYFVDPKTVPGWIVVSMFAGYYLAFVLGYLAKFELARLAPPLPWIASGLSLLAAVGVILALNDRYQSVTTRELFLAGVPGTALSQHPVGSVVGIAGAVLGVIGIVLFVWSRRLLVSGTSATTR